jgi:hypothetical protein
MTNEDRALRAGTILDEMRERHEEGFDIDTQTLVTDFLADLMHYAGRSSSLDLTEALRMAEIHFEAETGK